MSSRQPATSAVLLSAASDFRLQRLQHDKSFRAGDIGCVKRKRLSAVLCLVTTACHFCAVRQSTPHERSVRCGQVGRWSTRQLDAVLRRLAPVGSQGCTAAGVESGTCAVVRAGTCAGRPRRCHVGGSARRSARVSALHLRGRQAGTRRCSEAAGPSRGVFVQGTGPARSSATLTICAGVSAATDGTVGMTRYEPAWYEGHDLRSRQRERTCAGSQTSEATSAVFARRPAFVFSTGPGAVRNAKAHGGKVCRVWGPAAVLSAPAHARS